MSLAEPFRELVRACFAGIWIETLEASEALQEIATVCRDEEWTFATWDLEAGFRSPSATEGAADPLSAVRALDNLASEGGTAVLALPNFHRFLRSPEIVQAVARQILLGKARRTFLVVLAPETEIPPELSRLFATLEHELPSREALREIATSIAVEPGELPEGPDFDRLLDAAAGLTRFEAEGAFSLSIVREARLAPQTLWELKYRALKSRGALELYRGTETFADLGGLEALKSFCKRSLARSRQGEVRARGVLLLGPPGVGKSAFAKALGTETGRPTLSLDMGALMGSLVGQSERNLREALKTADAMAPCLLYVDEIEKSLAGLGGSGDSGVAARLFATLLTWLNDRTSDVYFVGTCNDISKLPPEFSRAERFDGVFFLDLPGRDDRRTVWDLYRRCYSVPSDQPTPEDADWTGAELRACCRLSALLDLPLTEAAELVVPVAHTAAESLGQLRSWADGRCLSADRPGIYRSTRTPSRRRAIPRDPSTN
ncbi:MAG TPA: AAA family ATPase [Pirellulaceae bacterium]|jgi:hypothetical protein|nr:AAA family ATPase [Pirellulaceae bacterium]